MVSKDDAGAEGILAYDKDLRQLTEFIQRNDRVTVLGALRILATVAKNSYKRVKISSSNRLEFMRMFIGRNGLSKSWFESNRSMFCDERC